MTTTTERVSTSSQSWTFLDQALDADSHEMIPMWMWRESFGDIADDMIQLTRARSEASGENNAARDDIRGDQTPINHETVWHVKGPEAPGAIDMHRRPAVLDEMGIASQLVFPTFGLWGLNIATYEGAPDFWGFDPRSTDHRSVGRAAVLAQNRWAIEIAREVDPDRVRVASIIMTETVDQMLADAQRALDGGCKVLWIPIGSPPAGTSPADRLLDPFWALAAEAGVPVVTHIGTEYGLLDGGWYRGAPEFAPGPTSSAEFVVEPLRSANLNLAQENFLTSMVFGGVFERHPTLRFGSVECGAQWVGPLAEKLDLWAGQFTRRLGSSLSMRPSEYLVRNFRATPFVFEEIDVYFERWPELVDLYCFSTDYPHREGGKDSKAVFLRRIQHLGEALCRKFFRENARLLFPTAAEG